MIIESSFRTFDGNCSTCWTIRPSWTLMILRRIFCTLVAVVSSVKGWPNRFSGTVPRWDVETETCLNVRHRSLGTDQWVCWDQVHCNTFQHGTIRIHCREWYFVYLKMFLIHMEQDRMNPFHTKNQLGSFYSRLGLFRPKWRFEPKPNPTGDFNLVWTSRTSSFLWSAATIMANRTRDVCLSQALRPRWTNEPIRTGHRMDQTGFWAIISSGTDFTCEYTCCTHRW